MDAPRNPFRPLGARLRDFARGRINRYSTGESTVPAGAPPSWQRDAGTPLQWDNAAGQSSNAPNYAPSQWQLENSTPLLSPTSDNPGFQSAAQQTPGAPSIQPARETAADAAPAQKPMTRLEHLNYLWTTHEARMTARRKPAEDAMAAAAANRLQRIADGEELPTERRAPPRRRGAFADVQMTRTEPPRLDVTDEELPALTSASTEMPAAIVSPASAPAVQRAEIEDEPFDADGFDASFDDDAQSTLSTPEIPISDASAPVNTVAPTPVQRAVETSAPTPTPSSAAEPARKTAQRKGKKGQAAEASPVSAAAVPSISEAGIRRTPAASASEPQSVVVPSAVEPHIQRSPADSDDSWGEQAAPDAPFPATLTASTAPAAQSQMNTPPYVQSGQTAPSAPPSPDSGYAASIQATRDSAPSIAAPSTSQAGQRISESSTSAVFDAPAAMPPVAAQAAIQRTSASPANPVPDASAPMSPVVTQADSQRTSTVASTQSADAPTLMTPVVSASNLQRSSAPNTPTVYAANSDAAVDSRIQRTADNQPTSTDVMPPTRVEQTVQSFDVGRPVETPSPVSASWTNTPVASTNQPGAVQRAPDSTSQAAGTRENTPVSSSQLPSAQSGTATPTVQRTPATTQTPSTPAKATWVAPVQKPAVSIAPIWDNSSTAPITAIDSAPFAAPPASDSYPASTIVQRSPVNTASTAFDSGSSPALQAGSRPLTNARPGVVEMTPTVQRDVLESASAPVWRPSRELAPQPAPYVSDSPWTGFIDAPASGETSNQPVISDSAADTAEPQISKTMTPTRVSRSRPVTRPASEPPIDLFEPAPDDGMGSFATPTFTAPSTVVQTVRADDFGSASTEIPQHDVDLFSALSGTPSPQANSAISIQTPQPAPSIARTNDPSLAQPAVQSPYANPTLATPSPAQRVLQTSQAVQRAQWTSTPTPANRPANQPTASNSTPSPVNTPAQNVPFESELTTEQRLQRMIQVPPDSIVLAQMKAVVAGRPFPNTPDAPVPFVPAAPTAQPASVQRAPTPNTGRPLPPIPTSSPAQNEPNAASNSGSGQNSNNSVPQSPPPAQQNDAPAPDNSPPQPESNGQDSGGGNGSPGATADEPNVESLAREVYSILRTKLRVERERRSGF